MEDDRFWLEENITEEVGTDIECPECGSELMFNENAFYPTYRRIIMHSVKCSNENCNYRDKIKIE
jgi:C4-type Zn-finger protein